jgi:protein-histidine pros-kinase
LISISPQSIENMAQSRGNKGVTGGADRVGCGFGANGLPEPARGVVMGLRTKFNLAVLAAFVIGFCVIGLLLKTVLEQEARSEALQNARVMMSAANAVRHYTAETVAPLTGTERDGKFLPASVPAFAAQTTFRSLRAEYPDYFYKEAALNPTNALDRANEWEAALINAFRETPFQSELVTERQTVAGAALTLARPIAITDGACLACHSQPSAAPRAMIADYGSDRGFGWRLNEVIGAQVISLPLATALAKAHQSLFLFLGILTGIFLLMLAILNVLLHYLVIKPVIRMSQIANDVSHGNMEAEDFTVPGRDEIASLSASFNRMRRSLASALRLLDAEEARPAA